MIRRYAGKHLLHVRRRIFVTLYGFEVLRSECLCVCMSVCQSVCSRISKITRPKFTKFLLIGHMLPVARYSSDCNAVMLRTRTSGFVYDVMFSHNGANRPQTKTTRMFRPIHQVAAPVNVRKRCLIKFATWRHRERSLLSPTISC